MKPVIIGVVAFVCALGGSTATVALRSRGSQAPSSAAPADSAAAHSAAPDSAATHVAAPAPVAPHDSLAQPAAAVTPAAAAAQASASDPVAAPATAAPQDTANPGFDYARVARIIANMKPDEQAKVLANLTDAEVEGVVRRMGARPAAAMLGLLPASRAAALSRRLLHIEPKSGSK